MKNTIIALAASAIALGSVNAQTLFLESNVPFREGTRINVQRVSDGQIFGLQLDDLTPTSHPSTILGSGVGTLVDYQLNVIGGPLQFSDINLINVLNDIDSTGSGSGTVTLSGGTATANDFTFTDQLGGLVNLDVSTPGQFSFDATTATNQIVRFTPTGTGSFSSFRFEGVTAFGDFTAGNFQLTGFREVPVPEPSSALLLGLGAFGLLGRRKR